jgi:prevent-host-death family protein
MQKIPAGQFKAQCLAVMDQVAQTGQPVIITKRGKPVVKLVPVEIDAKDIFGFMAGKARVVGDIETSAPLSDWNLR